MVNPYQAIIDQLKELVAKLQARSAAGGVTQPGDTPEEELRQAVICLAGQLGRAYTELAKARREVRGVV